MRLGSEILLSQLVILGVCGQSVKIVDGVTAVAALLLSQERLTQLAIYDVLLRGLSNLDLV